MEALFESIGQQPDVTYLIFLVGGWIGVLALFIPGTGVIEVVAGVGLLFGFGGLWVAGGSLPGLLLIVASFAVYGLTTLRRVTAGDETGLPLSAWGLALLATAGQLVGGLLLVGTLPALSVWLVIGLALASLALYRWMLLPVLNALRPQPQSGVESLIGVVAEVRRAPEAPGQPGMVYLNGELWQAVCDEPLSAGDPVRVVSRKGMRLKVEKIGS